MFKKFMSVCAVSALTFLMVSCGSGPSAVAKDAKAAAEKGDVEAFKECFVSSEAKKLDTMMAKIVMAMYSKVEIGAESVDGDKGTVELTLDGKAKKFNCVKENGKWKLTAAE